jgi:hypothetical protein
MPKSEMQFVVPLERLVDEDMAQVLIIHCNSGDHISEADISPPSDSDTEEGDRKATGCRDRSNTTQSQPSACVIQHL